MLLLLSDGQPVAVDVIMQALAPMQGQSLGTDVNTPLTVLSHSSYAKLLHAVMNTSTIAH